MWVRAHPGAPGPAGAGPGPWCASSTWIWVAGCPQQPAGTHYPSAQLCSGAPAPSQFSHPDFLPGRGPGQKQNKIKTLKGLSKPRKEERTMERDVRVAKQPVTQHFCTVNTSCSLQRWQWQLTEQAHTHSANITPPGEWQKFWPLDCAAAKKTQNQRLLELQETWQNI